MTSLTALTVAAVDDDVRGSLSAAPPSREARGTEPLPFGADVINCGADGLSLGAGA
jgi:hypothetical protein